MNRKKINSIIAIMSTILTVNLGGSINVQALESDKDAPSLQEHQKSEITSDNKNSENYVENSKEESASLDSESKSVNNDNTEASTSDSEAVDTKDNVNNESVAEANNNEDIPEKAVEQQNPATENQDDSKQTTGEKEALDEESTGEGTQDKEAVGKEAQDKEVTDEEAVGKEAQDKEVTGEEATEKEATGNEILDEKTASEEILESEEEVEAEEEVDVEEYGVSASEAITNINSGNGTVSDYKAVCGAKSPVEETNLYFFNKGIAYTKSELKVEKLSKAQIMNAVSDINYSWEFLSYYIVDTSCTDLYSYEEYGLHYLEGSYELTDVNVDDINKLLQSKYIGDDGNIDEYVSIDDIQKSIGDALNTAKRICQGQASIKDYTDFGIENLNFIEEDIDKFNELVKEATGGELSDFNSIRTHVNSVVKLIEKVSNGNGALEDYDKLGIEKVTDENLSQINTAVRLSAEGKILSITEISNIVEVELVKGEVFEKINKGEVSKDDFIKIKMPDVADDVIDYLNMKFKKTPGNIKTIDDVNTVINEANEYLQHKQRLCSGEGTLDDYKEENIEGVTADNIAAINEDIKKAYCSTIEQVKECVEASLSRLSVDLLKKVTAGTATCEDYAVMNIKGVNSTNLDFVNSQVKNHSYNSIDEVRNAVDTALKCLQAIKNINNGSAVLDDYLLIGVTDVTENNIEFINRNVRGCYVYTLDGIKSEIQRALDLYLVYIRINEGNGTVKDYSTIGVTDVTNDNIKKINAAVKGKGYYEAYKIQEIVTGDVKSTSAITRISQGKGELNDYALLEIKGVNDVNLSFINNEIKSKDCTSQEAIANAVADLLVLYASVDKINSGIGEVRDYELVGTKSVDLSNIKFINEYLKGCTEYRVVELQRLIENAVSAYNIIGLIYKGQATAEQFKEIGVAGLELDNFQIVKESLANNDFLIDSNIDAISKISKIKAKVDDILGKILSKKRINNGIAALSDYSNLNIEGLTRENLEFINTYIKGSDYDDEKDIQVAVYKARDLFDRVTKINHGDGTLEDYDAINTLKVNKSNIDYVNDYCEKNNEYQLVRLVNAVNEAVNEYDTIEKIKSGTASVSDYRLINIYKVNSNNLSYINSRINQNILNIIVDEGESQLILKEKIENEVDDATKRFDAITAINNGTATFANYQTALDLDDDDTIINDNNIGYINFCLKGQNLIDKYDIQSNVNSAVEGFKIIDRINKGTGVIADYVAVYNMLKIEETDVPVTTDNLKYINAIIKNKNYVNPYSIKDCVERGIKEFESIKKMENGTAEVDDYNLLGISGVTETNISYIALIIKEKSPYETPQQIQGAVDIALNNYDSLQRMKQGTANIGDYELLDIEGVTEENLAFINSYLKNIKNYDADKEHDLNTNEDAKNRVKEACAKYDAVQRINDGNAIVADYDLLGIKDIDNINISFVNDTLKNKNLESIEVIVEASEIAIKDYNALVRINEGNGTVDDYKLLGAAGVIESNLYYVNDNLANKNYMTVTEVTEKAEIAVNIFNIINKIIAGNAKMTDYNYNYVNIQGVSNENIQFINANIKDGKLSKLDKLPSIPEIQSEVNRLIELYKSFTNINEGIAILSDYITTGIFPSDPSDSNYGKYDSIILYINADLKDKNLLTANEIKTVINKNLNIYYSLKAINSGKAVLKDYENIGSISVTEDCLDFLNQSLKNSNTFAVEEMRKLVERRLTTKGSYGRINNGVGTLKDYELAGALSVTEYNINYVNSEIVGRINVYGTNVVTEVEAILKLYDTVEAVNNAEETLTDDNCVKEFLDISNVKIPYDTSEGSKLSMIKQCVEISRRLANNKKLTEKEIKKIIDLVNSCPEDAYEVLSRINKQLAAETKNINKELTPEQEESIITDLIATIKETVINVCAGKGSVEEFKFLGISDVTSENVAIINEDIYRYNTVNKLSEYRVGDLQSVVDKGKAILSINNSIAQPSDFEMIGITMPNDTSENSLFNLVKNAINITREMNKAKAVNDATLDKNGYLNREDIANLVEKVRGSQEDAASVMSDIMHQIEKEKALKQRALTYEEEDAVINNYINDRKERIGRVLSGMATLDDYKYLGQIKVNSDNIDIINTDIYNNKTIKKISELRINQLESAINQGIAIYEINNANQQNAVSNFAAIGQKVVYSDVETSEFKLIEQYIKLKRSMTEDNNYLTRSEILEIISDIRDNLSDNRVIIPRITKEINDREKNGTTLTSNQVKSLFEEVKETINKICKRVVTGDGTLEDYQYLGKTDVTAENIGVINQDIKDNHTMSASGTYSLNGLDNAVEQGLAVYSINNNDDESVGKQFEVLKISLSYDPSETSKYKLVKAYINLQRKLLGGRELNRKEITDIVNNINQNFADMQSILPKVTEAVNNKEKESTEQLTAEEINELIESVKDNISKICQRVASGEGTLEDYKFLNQTLVTKDNINIINNDIKTYRPISVSSSYTLNGLEEAVKSGLAVYYINNNSDASIVQNFKQLGINITADTSETSKFNLITSEIRIQRALKNGDYLNRKEILAIESEINSNYADEAVIIPRVINELDKKQKEKGSSLTVDEVKTVISTVENDIKEICKRVMKGEGTEEDYNYLGETKVTSDNIDIINNDIKKYGKISLLTSYRIDGLEDEVNKGLAIYKINNDTDKTVVDALKALGITVEYNTEETSEFGLILAEVEIEKLCKDGANLDRKEILDIVSKVKDKKEDLAVVIPEVTKRIKQQQRESEEGTLTKEQINELIKKVENDIKEICNRVAGGEGTLSDYNFLGQSKVTADNINIINRDIKKYKTVTLLSSYRLNGLEQAVNAGLSIYEINNNNNDDAAAEYFKSLGIDVEVEEGSDSKLKLIESEVKLKRMVEGGRELTREEIKYIVDYVTNNLDDEKVIVPKINEEIIKQQQGKELTSEEVKNIISSVKDTINKVCNRITVGNAIVDDYIYLGETRVTTDNIGVINADIAKYKSVTMLSNYRLSGLEQAVTEGLAIYRINNNTENSAINDFKLLDIELTYDTEKTSLFKLVQSGIKFDRKVKNNDYLTRQEIKDIVTNISDHLEDSKVVIASINDAINAAEKQEGTKLNATDTDALIKNTIEERKKVIIRICSGEATVDDYLAVGEKRITSKLIDIANAEVKEFRTITNATDLTLNDTTKAIDLILDVYAINEGFETERHDVKIIHNSYGDVVRQTNTNYRVSQYEDLGKFVVWDDSASSTLTLIKDAVKIMRAEKEGRYLTRREIIDSVITPIENSLESSKIMIPRILYALTDTKNSKNTALTTTEVEVVINDEKERMKDCIDRIYIGKGEVRDFAYLNESRVNESNLNIINDDIKQYKDITKVSDYQLRGLSEEVTKALALYNINNGNVSKAADNNVKEYAELGRNVAYDYNEISVFGIAQDYILIKKKLNNNEYLTRQTIIDTIDDVVENFDKYKLIIPQISDEIFIEEDTQGKPLSSEEIEKIIAEVQSQTKIAVKRLALGKGKLADYRLFGEDRVTSINIDVINYDIQENKNVLRTSDYSLDGLTEAVDQGLAVFNLNNGKETESNDGKVKEFKTLDLDIESDGDKLSVDKLVMTAIKIAKRVNDGNYITRDKIIDIVYKVQDNLETAKSKLYNILTDIENDDITKGRTISGSEVKQIVDKNLQQI